MKKQKLLRNCSSKKTTLKDVSLVQSINIQKFQTGRNSVHLRPEGLAFNASAELFAVMLSATAA
jgi:hypothetical protein